jgi:hypothetical protein
VQIGFVSECAMTPMGRFCDHCRLVAVLAAFTVR